MNRILKKTYLSDKVCLIEVHAPLIAEERRAGQFIILQVEEDYGERIPLTIADADTAKGSIKLIYQIVGETTQELSLLEEGDDIPVLVGPLGKPTHIEKYGTVIGVGGGIGAAPLFPIVEAMKKIGNKVIVIIGAQDRERVIMAKEMSEYTDELIICTDDGSLGKKGFVTGPLLELCEANIKPDRVMAIGPPAMMRACSELTRPFGIHTEVSLNTIMVDGTGMCGGCRVDVGGETKFVCVDGPEFDGHQVDFDNMISRMRSYQSFEKKHACNLHREFDKKKASHD